MTELVVGFIPLLDCASLAVAHELGFAVMSKNERCRFSAGYMISQWDNMVTTPEYFDAVKADKYTNVDGQLSFSGLVSRVEMRW